MKSRPTAKTLPKEIKRRNLDVEPLTPKELRLQRRVSRNAGWKHLSELAINALSSSSTGKRIGDFTARNASSDATNVATVGEYDGTLPDGDNNPDNPHAFDDSTEFEQRTNNLVLDGLIKVSPEQVMHPDESTSLYGSHRTLI
jgi:hypothetical protein